MPHWPTDRWRRQAERQAERQDWAALALTAVGQGGLRLVAVDAAAAAEGLRPGMTLGDARALLPSLRAAEADPLTDQAALAGLADWCTRYSPWSAVDGDDGICLEITGAAHLFGGEEKLAEDLLQRLGRARIATRVAIAAAPAAAWAWARFGEGVIVPPDSRARLGLLPPAALRLPAETIVELGRLGLRSVAAVAALPRGPLAARFGMGLLDRLDQLFGLVLRPISPRHPPAPWRTRMAFAEPIGRPEDLEAATRHLLGELDALLERAGRGARQLSLVCYRVDGSTERLEIGTSRPVRAPDHLLRLFRERLALLDPGFGVEVMLLEATASEALPTQQIALEAGTGTAGDDLAVLVDRLRNRFGPGQVVQFMPADSHEPSRVMTLVPALSVESAADWPATGPRPIRLLPSPEPIEAMAPVPDDPPLQFRWRRVSRRVVRADGPERIAPEWWRADHAARSRDYYRLEDEAGQRFWVYRDGPYRPDQLPRWYLHGLFA